MRMLRVFGCIALLMWCFFLQRGVSLASEPSTPAKANSLLGKFQEQRAEHLERFVKQVTSIRQAAEARSDDIAVKELDHWLAPVKGEELLTRHLPAKAEAPISRDLPEVERQWRIELKAARTELAKDLYLLSRRVLNGNQVSFAWSLLHEVTHFDADHDRARTLLGYERVADDWMTPFSARMLKKNFVQHPQYGWLPQSHVKRYENGERCFRTQWMSAERESSIRQDFKNAWEVETDHYKVKTNVSLERGVELANALEVFHAYFRSSFAAFFNTPEVLKKQFESTVKTARPIKQFEVHFFRTQDEYVNRLKKGNPQISITNGIYMPDDRTAFFFENADPDADVESTLYHEATHQILYELHPQARKIAEHEHFWIIEGIACYMESFRQTEQGFSIGNPKFVRFQDARYRAIEDRYHVPLRRLSEMGKVAFQYDPNIKKNYSESSGLAHFFMHAQDGRYRDALVQHLELLYRPHTGRVRIAGLDQLTGATYEELDQQYLEHMRELGQ